MLAGLSVRPLADHAPLCPRVEVGEAFCVERLEFGWCQTERLAVVGFERLVGD